MYLMRWKMQDKQPGPNVVRWIDRRAVEAAVAASEQEEEQAAVVLAMVVQPDLAEASAWTEDIAVVCSTAVCQTATASQFMCLASIR